MNQNKRYIFQPWNSGKLLIDGHANISKKSNSDIINFLLVEAHLPNVLGLRDISESIFRHVENDDDIQLADNHASIIQAVQCMRNHAIANYAPLKQIMDHFFCNKTAGQLNYEFINVVNDKQLSILRRGNEVLKSVDSLFVSGNHEIGEWSRYIFDHWEQLSCYGEIYMILSTLIECADSCVNLDTFKTILLIKMLDNAIRDSSIPLKGDNFPAVMTTDDKFHAISYEISVYLNETAYSALSGDLRFENTTQDLYDFMLKADGIISLTKTNVSDADLATVIGLEREGRNLFRRIIKRYKENT